VIFKKARFRHEPKTPNFPLPKTPFKTEWVVEGLWHFDGEVIGRATIYGVCFLVRSKVL
jgi:hypothetical protein|tara:strand:+ start:1831 stop:2007 length:177 start_codon:yes stop_codon:yes gene_type:complete